MKQGSFGALLLREWYMTRRYLLMMFAIISGIIAICLLISLSFYHGNLAVLLKDSPEVKMQALPILKWLVVPCASFMPVAVLDSAALDQNRKWAHFIRTTPVSRMRIAAAKCIMFGGVYLLGTGIALGYLWFITKFNDMTLDRGDAAIFVSIIIFLLLFFTNELAIVTLCHIENKVKAELCTMAIECIPIVGYSIYKSKFDPIDEAEMSAYTAKLLTFAEDYILPAAPFIIIALLCICFCTICIGCKKGVK